jgi:cellulose synthase/poly-beta-1,6-N-acetylglucosamine synthase-like glycosyltransferase
MISSRFCVIIEFQGAMSIGQYIIYFVLFVLLYNQVFLLITFFEKRKKALTCKKSELPATFPTVTIIVPCFNEENTVRRTVESLLALDYPKDRLSIFLINDGSIDGTQAIMDSYANYSNIKVFHKANEGKWKTLNFGLQYVTSDMVGCLDADSFVESNALKEIVACFHENPAAMAVTPSMRVWQPNTIIRHVQSAEYDLGIFMRKAFSFLGSIHITPGPFSIFKKNVFEIIGPYRHAHNTEDLEIALRMQKAGMVIDNAHNAIVYTVGPATPYRLYRQRVRWTGGYLKNMIEYRDMLFHRNYGHLSFWVLPMTLIAVFSSLYLITAFLVTGITGIVHYLKDLHLINFDLPEFSFKLDWFFIDTTAASLIGLALILTILASVFIGRIITNKKKLFSLDLVYFITLYSFIAPFWLVRSVYDTVLFRETKWR